MKTFLTLLTFIFCLSAIAETADSMLIHKSDGSIITIALNDIDSTTFQRTSLGLSSTSSLPGDSLSAYYEVEALSKDIAYLVTNKNKLMKTIDGGESWSDITPDSNAVANITGATSQVSFYTEDIGAVAFSVDDGANSYNTSLTYGYVWCTTDGGESWSEMFSVNEDQILHLHQVNDTVVYVSGTASYGSASNRWFKKITRTKSTGQYALTSISSPPYSLPHTMAGDWHNQNEGIMLFKNNTHYLIQPYVTTNGGASWTSINGDLPSISQAYNTMCGRSLKMIDSDSYVYVTTYNSGNTVKLWRTDNGGTNWTEGVFDETPTGRLTSVDFFDDQNGIVAGYDSINYYYVTSDGGANWTKKDIANKASTQIIYCTEYAPDGSIWLSGNLQGLWREE